MENNNVDSFQSNKPIYSSKISKNLANSEYNTSLNHLGYSMTSSTEINNLMFTERERKIRNKGILNELFGYYIKVPKKNNTNIINNPNNINNMKNSKENFSLSKIFKKRKYAYEWELYDYFDFYQTIVYYKEGGYHPNINSYKKCRFVIKDQYLYLLNILNKNSNLFFINPDNSFIKRIEKKEKPNNEDIKYLKFDYELSNPILCLNFELLTCHMILNKIDEREFTLLILGTSKKYSFIIEDKKTKDKFCYILGNLIYNSYGALSNKVNLVLSNKNFYCKTFITPEDFEYCAKTGDIILFKSKHILSSLQRCFTMDNYDHIAIVQSNYGLITLFDASKIGSCKFHFWETFKSSSNQISFKRVTYRRLNIEERDYEKKAMIQEKIEILVDEFIKEIKDKKYYLSISDLLFKGKPKDYELKGEWSKSKGFSCSSLVAALYLKLGVIKLKNTVHSIYPGDFEQNKNKNFEFLPGFSLGPEKIIHFLNE